MTMRISTYAVLALLGLVLAPPAGSAADLRIAAWNLEHLDDDDGAGCVGRSASDYAALARQIEALDADIVAFQEVENAAAAHRVFPASGWHVEMSRRPPMERSRACWDKPEARLGHLATGFAVRRGIDWRRNADLEAPGAGGAFQRWAVDMTVMAGGRRLRLLSVHLKTGCWGAKQDRKEKSREACTVLRGQIERLKGWADTRRAARGLRHPGGLQPPAGAGGRLGLAHPVAAPGAAAAADRRRAVPLRPAFPGVHRPHGGGRRR